MPRKTEVTCLPHHPLARLHLQRGWRYKVFIFKVKIQPVTVPRSHELQVFCETHFADFILTADLSSLACFQDVYHVGSNSMVPGLYTVDMSTVFFWSYCHSITNEFCWEVQGMTWVKEVSKEFKI